MRFVKQSFILCCLAGLLISCQSESTSEHVSLRSVPAVKAAHTMHFPTLLDRSEGLGSLQERQAVMETYQEIIGVLQVDPTDYKRRLQLAQLYMLEARVTGEHGYYYPATLQILDDILQEQPEKGVRFSATSLKASVNLSLHHFAEAQDLAQQAIQLNGYNAVIYGSLVDAYVELGDYESAIDMAEKMMSLRPDLRSYARASYLREIHGDPAGAVEAMKLAISAGYPGYEETAWCRLTLGGLYEQMGKLDSAQQQYQLILAQRANYPFAIAGLAQLEAKRGNYEQAVSHLQQAIQLIPEVGFYIQLAEIYLETGRKDEAQKLSKEILAMLEDDEAKGHQMSLEFAQVYLHLLGQPKEAMVYAQKAYKERPQNIDVNVQMAEVWGYEKNWAKALPFIKVATRTGKLDPKLLCLAGLTYFHTGYQAKGRELITQSFGWDPYQTHPWVVPAQHILKT